MLHLLYGRKVQLVKLAGCARSAPAGTGFRQTRYGKVSQIARSELSYARRRADTRADAGAADIMTLLTRDSTDHRRHGR